MSNLDSMLRGATISSEINEKNEDLVAAITKLSSITEMFTSSYGEFVLEVHVSPMNVLQTKMADIREITVYVVHNILGNDNQEPVADMRDFLTTMMSDEFEGVTVKIEMSTYANWVVPSLLLYTVFPINKLENAISNELYWTLYVLINNYGYTVSYPVSVEFHTVKSIFIHCGEMGAVVPLSRICKEINMGVDLREVRVEAKKKGYDCDTVYYVPMIAKKPLEYGLPYEYITHESFDEQYIQSVLNMDKSQ